MTSIAAKSALYDAARQAVFAYRFSHPPAWLMYLYVLVHM